MSMFLKTFSLIPCLFLTENPFLSECALASPGSPCTNLEVSDCKYKSPSLPGERCCCGQCTDSSWLSLACVSNSTTGSGLWQTTSICPADGCGSKGEWCGDNKLKCPFCWVQLGRLHFTGVVTSPNHPKSYPHNLEKTERIKAEGGKVLRLEFTRFTVHPCNSDTATCPCDFVNIVEGDGTTLMDRGCGYSYLQPSHSYYFLPPIFTSNSDTVDIFFHTDSSGAAFGWSLNWTAVTPGGRPLCKILSAWSATMPGLIKHFELMQDSQILWFSTWTVWVEYKRFEKPVLI